MSWHNNNIQYLKRKMTANIERQKPDLKRHIKHARFIKQALLNCLMHHNQKPVVDHFDNVTLSAI
jgi:hypothetical protein